METFAIEYLDQYPDDYVCDFIREALSDPHFDWDEPVQYLENTKACRECLQCAIEFEMLYRDSLTE